MWQYYNFVVLQHLFDLIKLLFRYSTIDKAYIAGFCIVWYVVVYNIIYKYIRFTFLSWTCKSLPTWWLKFGQMDLGYAYNLIPVKYLEMHTYSRGLQLFCFYIFTLSFFCIWWTQKPFLNTVEYETTT